MDPKCLQLSKWNYGLGAFGVISDFYLLCLPIPVILRMKMPSKKKIGCALYS